MKRYSLTRCVSSVIGTGVILCASVVHAQSIPVLNHAYEFDTIPQETQKTDAISGWLSSGDGDIGVEIPLGGGIAYNGFDNLSQAAFIKEGGKISQALNFNVIKGQTYALKYRIGRPLGEQGHSLIARFKAQGLTLAQHQTHVTQLAEGEWGEAELRFTASENMPVGFPIAVEFYNPPSELGAKVHIDSVSVNLVESQTTPSNLINITVLNDNYEFDTVPVDTDKTDFISGWLSTGNGAIGVEFPQGGGIDYTANASFGQAAYLQKGGRISQALNLNLAMGESYTLHYNVGRPLGTSDHSVIARVTSQGLVLAQQHTRAEHVEPGQRLAQSITFTATEEMPLGSKVAIEFYNPPTASGAKVHIDEVQMQIAGTGQEYIAPPLVKFPNEVIDDVVNTNLTIHIPEDFDNLHQAIGYLDNKIIQIDKLVTIQVNDCDHTYNEPLVMSHPQGSQITIQGHKLNCELNFNGDNGLIVSTGLKELDSFYFSGSRVGRSDTGLVVIEGGTVGNVTSLYSFHWNKALVAKHGSFLYVNGSRSASNYQSSITSEFNALVELKDTQIDNSSGQGLRVTNSGNLYSQGTLRVYNNSQAGILVLDNSYIYLPSNNLVNNNGNSDFNAFSLSNFDITNSFASNGTHFFIGRFSSWINVYHNPRRSINLLYNSYYNYR